MAVLPLALVMQMTATPACSFPGMVPQFWPHVLNVESRYGGGYSQFALHDDDANQSYYPDTQDAAEALARRLMAQGHSVGVGLSQLTARSEGQFFTKFHLTVRQALDDACTNLRAGARFFVERALSIYNSGSPTGAPRYAVSITDAIQNGTASGAPALPAPPVPLPDTSGPVVFTPGGRDPKQAPPSWNVWGNETSQHQSGADGRKNEGK